MKSNPPLAQSKNSDEDQEKEQFLGTPEDMEFSEELGEEEIPSDEADTPDRDSFVDCSSD
jgi:hypothetical protein